MSLLDLLTIGSGAADTVALIASLQFARIFFTDEQMTSSNSPFSCELFENAVIHALLEKEDTPSNAGTSHPTADASLLANFFLQKVVSQHGSVQQDQTFSSSLSQQFAELLRLAVVGVRPHQQELYQQSHPIMTSSSLSTVVALDPLSNVLASSVPGERELELFILLASSDRPLLVRKLSSAIEYFFDTHVSVNLTSTCEEIRHKANSSSFKTSIPLTHQDSQDFRLIETTVSKMWLLPRVSSTPNISAVTIATTILDWVLICSTMGHSTPQPTSLFTNVSKIFISNYTSVMTPQAKRSPSSLLPTTLSDLLLVQHSSNNDIEINSNELPIGNLNTPIPDFSPQYVSSGCTDIDFALGGTVPMPNPSVPSPTFFGGFLKGHLTEIYGEAGSGKTQIGLSTVCFNASIGYGAIYLVSEDVPQRRIRQFADHFSFSSEQNNPIQQRPSAGTSADYSKLTLDRVFIRKVPDLESLISTLSPSSLDDFAKTKKVNVIVVDSIAACAQGSLSIQPEGDDAIDLNRQSYSKASQFKRTREGPDAKQNLNRHSNVPSIALETVGAALLGAAARLNVAVVTINQVRADMWGTGHATSSGRNDTSSNGLMPALGLRWSNIVNSRFSLKRLTNYWVTIDAASGLVYRADGNDLADNNTNNTYNNAIPKSSALPPQPIRALTCEFSSFRPPGVCGHFAIGPDRLVSAPIGTL